MTVCRVCERPIVKTFETTTGEAIWDHVAPHAPDDEAWYMAAHKLRCWTKAQPKNKEEIHMEDRKLSIEDIAEPVDDRIVDVHSRVIELRGLRFLTQLEIAVILRYSDLWTSQHPIVPSEEDVEGMMFGMYGLEDLGRVAVRSGAEQWQRRMYLKRAPELPAGVKAIMEDYGVMENGKTTEMVGKIVMLMQEEAK